MQELVRQHQLRAQAQMKRQADQHRSERRSFASSNPYVQSAVMPRAHYKLSFKYFGPYQIEARVGAMACRVELVAHSRINCLLRFLNLAA